MAISEQVESTIPSNFVDRSQGSSDKSEIYKKILFKNLKNWCEYKDKIL